MTNYKMQKAKFMNVPLHLSTEWREKIVRFFGDVLDHPLNQKLPFKGFVNHIAKLPTKYTFFTADWREGPDLKPYQIQRAHQLMDTIRDKMDAYIMECEANARREWKYVGKSTKGLKPGTATHAHRLKAEDWEARRHLARDIITTTRCIRHLLNTHYPKYKRPTK